jgi:acetyltransferase-like isoleucine patch superfamily enzyme
MEIANRLKFEMYSYAEHIIWSLLNLFPHFIRNLFFRVLFKRIGRGCLIDYDVYVRYPFKVSIGNGTAINRGCRLYSSFMVKEAEIIIGNNVALAPHVTFFSAGHDYRTIDLKDTAATIRIGDNAWIGGGSFILQGVTVGEGAIIGAGSIVVRDVPAWSIVLGNPAKVVGSREISDLAPGERNSATES